jgi:uncharacterized protein (TIGR00255 family)
MTGFARSERHGDWGTLVWELRTVNHRYLDISLRLPEGFSVYEAAIRTRLQKSLQRGRVDVWLRFQAVEGGGLRLNRDLAVKLQTIYSELLQCWNLRETALNPLDALRWPGLVQSNGTDSAVLEEEVLSLLDGTIEELQATREREGAALAQMLLSRVEAIGEQTGALRAHLPELEEAVRNRLQTRLADLAIQVDPQRWEQEILFYLQRQDTAEELDRLDTHLQELRRILTRREAVGRRLDFLMQELNREANTLASKAADSQVTFASVELKVLIEQMREQVQNVE